LRETHLLNFGQNLGGEDPRKFGALLKGEAREGGVMFDNGDVFSL
jgi:hypothetical protein